MGYTMKDKLQKEKLSQSINVLLENHSPDNILEVLIEECPRAEMDSLVSTMESEVSYRGKYKMIKIETMDQEIKLEEFLNQLYPMYNDRSNAILL
jgi:hypothetical protein